MKHTANVRRRMKVAAAIEFVLAGGFLAFWTAFLLTEEPLPDGGLYGGSVLACLDLMSAIEEDRLPECNVYEARMTIEMISAVFESHRLGGPAKCPLQNRGNPLELL